jgi:hypothetical protein
MIVLGKNVTSIQTYIRGGWKWRPL